jgi:hypothetical protein
MLVIHNVSLEVPPKTWAFWQIRGRVQHRGPRERSRDGIYDRDGSVLFRASV